MNERTNRRARGGFDKWSKTMEHCGGKESRNGSGGEAIEEEKEELLGGNRSNERGAEIQSMIHRFFFDP